MIPSFPSEWSVLFADSSLGGEWERKEDLLQLHHEGLDRIVDLGWYRSEFAIVVFQGDFHGKKLAEVRCSTQAEAEGRLQEVVRTWGSGRSR